MKTALIFILNLAGLGLVLGLPTIVLHKGKCQEVINYYCGPKVGDWEEKIVASYDKRCKKRHDWMKDDFNRVYARVCAGNYDFEKTCDYLFQVFRKYHEHMGMYGLKGKCLSKLQSCEEFMKKKCKKDTFHHAYLNWIFTDEFQRTDECAKKVGEEHFINSKIREESCKDKRDFEKKCERFVKAADQFWNNLLTVCKPKN